MFGVTPQGFVRKTYNDIVGEMGTRAQSLFGDDINLSERSPLGMFIRVIAWFLGILWQIAEAVYNSAYVDTATDVSLDRVVKYIGLKRRVAEKATGEVTFLGDSGIPVPVGTVVLSGDIQFLTDSEVVLVGGTATIGITAAVGGTSGNVPANTIVDLLNPIAGIDSLTNEEKTDNGRNKETDDELRGRYQKSVAKGGSSTTDSITAKLLEVKNIRAALVLENDTMATVSGIPPKALECYVLGGEDSDVAKAIFDSKAAGIQAYGDVILVVTDKAGQPHNIGFTRATEKTVYCDIALTTNSAFPSDGNAKIKTAIIQYLGGTDEDGSIYAGLTMGEDVIYNKMVGVINSIPGITDFDLGISFTDSGFVSTNLSVGTTEVAETIYSAITIS